MAEQHVSRNAGANAKPAQDQVEIGSDFGLAIWSAFGLTEQMELDDPSFPGCEKQLTDIPSRN